MKNATVGKMYKLKDGVAGHSSGPAQYQAPRAILTAVLDDIDGGLYFEHGLAGIRYWNIADVEEVDLSD